MTHKLVYWITIYDQNPSEKNEINKEFMYYYFVNKYPCQDMVKNCRSVVIPRVVSNHAHGRHGPLEN